jgi:predicted nucleotidyltransferase
MVDFRDIQAVCAQIVREFNPRKVILFGSHAGGTPTADSDVDLMVILPFEGSPLRMAGEIRARLDHRFPMDLLVRTPEHIQERIRLNDFFIRDILSEGRVLYDAAGAGVG